MLAHAVTPILNVSDIIESFAWFEKLGWTKGFDWGSPPTFGAVCSGECEIFLCQGAQGGRGKSGLPTTRGHGEAGDKGVWMGPIPKMWWWAPGPDSIASDRFGPLHRRGEHGDPQPIQDRPRRPPAGQHHSHPGPTDR